MTAAGQLQPAPELFVDGGCELSNYGVRVVSFSIKHRLRAPEPLATAEYQNVFRAMVSKRSGALIQQLFRKIMVDLARDDVKAIVGRREDSSASMEAVVQFVAGGLFGLATLWASGKLRMSVEEVNEPFRHLAMPAVKAALQ
jgi:hypothetical protein